MANFTWTVVTSNGTISQDGPTISDTNMQRFLDFVWEVYPQYEADGETRKAKTNANLAASVRDWMTAQWNGTKAAVLQFEKAEAAKAAREGISDLEG